MRRINIVVMIILAWISVGTICGAGMNATWRADFKPETDHQARDYCGLHFSLGILTGPIAISPTLGVTGGFRDGLSFECGKVVQ